MWRFSLGLFLMAHGFVHPWTWAFPGSGSSTPQGSSWLLHGVFGLETTDRTLTATIAWIATVALMLAGLLVWFGIDVWKPAAIAGAIASGLAIFFVFKPALSLGLLINVGIVWAALGPHWPVTKVVAAP